jgi:hypothetical protein
MTSGPDPAAGYPYGQLPYSPVPGPTPGHQGYDPITGQPLPPGPAAYSAVDPYAAQPSYQQGYQQGYPPAGPPPGYPPYGAPMGYQLVPMYPARPAKPGAAVAASVLGYVQGGLAIFGGIILLSATSTADNFGFNSRLSSELTVVGILILVTGGLLIAGATTMLNRRTGLLAVGCALSIAISVYFVIKLADFVGGGSIWVPIVYAILPIISAALSMGSEVRAWSRTRNTDR